MYRMNLLIPRDPLQRKRELHSDYGACACLKVMPHCPNTGKRKRGRWKQLGWGISWVYYLLSTVWQPCAWRGRLVGSRSLRGLGWLAPGVEARGLPGLPRYGKEP